VPQINAFRDTIHSLCLHRPEATEKKHKQDKIRNCFVLTFHSLQHGLGAVLLCRTRLLLCVVIFFSLLNVCLSAVRSRLSITRWCCFKSAFFIRYSTPMFTLIEFASLLICLYRLAI